MRALSRRLSIDKYPKDKPFQHDALNIFASRIECEYINIVYEQDKNSLIKIQNSNHPKYNNQLERCLNV